MERTRKYTSSTPKGGKQVEKREAMGRAGGPVSRMTTNQTLHLRVEGKRNIEKKGVLHGGLVSKSTRKELWCRERKEAV